MAFDQVTDADEPEVVTGTREQLLHLLAEAAEIEHALMCSYLYAAFSLKRGEVDGLTSEQATAVGRWRECIMHVAIEEMGHLVTVANLTVAVGGRPHFARPNFPIATGYFPSDVVVRLTGFSRETLDHFIYLERPQGIEGADAAEFEQRDYSRDQAHHGLMPSTQDYRTIGHLYEAIRTNLRHLCERLGAGALFVGSPAFQLGADVTRLEGVDQIGDFEAASAALDLIIEQGEGSTADRESSHYRRFLGIGNELDALLEEDAAFAPAWPVADNPVLRRPPEPEDKVFVEEPEAVALLDFACASYGLLLRLLVQAFARDGAAARTEQEALFSAAIELMHVVGDSSAALSRMPAAPGSCVNAGMSFTMLRGVEPLLPGLTESQLLREQMAELAGRSMQLAVISAKSREALKRLTDGFSLAAETPHA